MRHFVSLLFSDIKAQANNSRQLSDDCTLPPGSAVARLGPMGVAVAAKIGKKFDVQDKMSGRMKTARFTKIHENLHKVWASERVRLAWTIMFMEPRHF